MLRSLSDELALVAADGGVRLGVLLCLRRRRRRRNYAGCCQGFAT